MLSSSQGGSAPSSNPSTPAKKPVKKAAPEKAERGHYTVPAGAAAENRRNEAEEKEEE